MWVRAGVRHGCGERAAVVGSGWGQAWLWGEGCGLGCGFVRRASLTSLAAECRSLREVASAAIADGSARAALGVVCQPIASASIRCTIWSAYLTEIGAAAVVGEVEREQTLSGSHSSIYRYIGAHRRIGEVKCV